MSETMGEILVIDLTPRPLTDCAACGVECISEQGLPVDDNGDFVDNDFAGEWGGVPACRRCFDVHAAGGVAALEAMLRHEETNE
jgi:hypothetical protein